MQETRLHNGAFKNGHRCAKLFETMIFGGEHDSYQERYATAEGARAGHARALRLVEGRDDDEPADLDETPLAEEESRAGTTGSGGPSSADSGSSSPPARNDCQPECRT